MGAAAHLARGATGLSPRARALRQPAARDYRLHVELLERDEELAVLAEARNAAAAGRGRVVIVSGEPGIGKSALVERFVADLGRGARVLAGACDDLSIPRP